MEDVRPASVCRQLLAALDASEGRRRRRKRDTTPDAIGLGIKRHILERAVDEDPAPDEFERWLVECCRSSALDAGEGALRAMAREVLTDWRLAAMSAAFSTWLERGAPSEDRMPRI